MDELVNAACAMTSRLIVQPWLFKSMRHTSVGLRGRSRQGVRHLGDARGELSKAATFEESIAYWNIRSASYPNGYFHDLRLSALYLAVEARTGITIPLAVLPRRLVCTVCIPRYYGSAG